MLTVREINAAAREGKYVYAHDVFARTGAPPKRVIIARQRKGAEYIEGKSLMSGLYFPIADVWIVD